MPQDVLDVAVMAAEKNVVKRPKAKPKPLLPLDDTLTPLYSCLNGSISGFVNCCSAAVMSAFNGGFRGHPNTCYSNPTRVLKPKVCESLAEWRKYYGTGIDPNYGSLTGAYAIPEEIAYLFFLEKVYTKANNGKGGVETGAYPMWAGTTWATKTWFIADRMTGRGYPDENLSCSKFMRFMRKEGDAQRYGRMAISNLADGAHGGQCAGGAWAPNLPYLQERLQWALNELHLHAQWIYDTYGAKKGSDDKLSGAW